MRTIPRLIVLSSLLGLALVVSACEGSEIRRDGDVAAGTDVRTGPDGAGPDGAAGDTTPADGVAPADGAAPLDGGADGAPTPDAGCTFDSLEPVLLHCDPAYLILDHQADLSGRPECPDRWALGDESWTSIAAAAADRGCDAGCVWRPASAVMFLHCGNRDEYIAWEAEAEVCPTLLQFSNGQFYDSIEDYEASNPCP